MPKCTINGKTIEVKEGTSVIQAFKEAGEDIAHYCWHPGLSVAGACRLCMVQVEGAPKLQIACNAQVQDGMVVTNQSEQVKEAVRWGMDFHLINHPLDCPICDQAGECGLQEQYMRYGQYDPEMSERKVKKRKVVDLGPKVVLDTERCILCSRCVRFTEEVSKTHELRIVNRGDRSEIGTFKDKPLDNNYSINTIDICPVGALTSKDFRFRQRVWYMKEASTICTGCSTGCSVNVHYNEEGAFRVKPRENHDVNGYWMCDKGRDVYRFVNRPNRLLKARKGMIGQWSQLEPGKAALEAGEAIRAEAEKDATGISVVVTGQYMNEEYQAFFDFFAKELGIKKIYHWVNNPEDMGGFDGLLFRGDRNPNTKGLEKHMGANGIKTSWSDLVKELDQGSVKHLVVAGPENNEVFPDLSDKLKLFSKAQNLTFLTAGKSEELDSVTTPAYQIPMKVYLEKEGTYTNYAGLEQKVNRGTTLVASALTLEEAAHLMSGKDLNYKLRPQKEAFIKTNFLAKQRGVL